MLKVITLFMFLLVSNISTLYAASATPVVPNVKLLVPIPLDCTSSSCTDGSCACSFNLSANNMAISFVKVDATGTLATINAPNGYTISGLTSYNMDLQGLTLMFILIDHTWYKF